MAKPPRFSPDAEVPVPGFDFMGIGFALGHDLGDDEAEPASVTTLELGYTLYDTAICHFHLHVDRCDNSNWIELPG